MSSPSEAEAQGCAAGSEAGKSLRGQAITAGVAAVALLGFYATSWLAGRAGFLTSAELVFEGQWYVASWGALPWPDIAGMIVFMIALPVCASLAAGEKPAEAGLRVDRAALAWIAAGLGVAGIVYGMRHGTTFPPASWTRVGSAGALVAYLSLVALAEEVTFRGFLQRRLSHLLPFWAGLLLASVAFAVWHGVWAPPEVILFRFAAGLVLGLLYHLGGSLLAPVVCHVLLSVILAV